MGTAFFNGVGLAGFTLPVAYLLKGNCYGDFAVCWTKLVNYLTKNLLYNMNLLLEHRGGGGGGI